MGSGASSTKNIIIFGETGAGKSSVINLLTNSSTAHVSDQAIGCTFRHQKYQYGDMTIYDTAGLSEGTMGTVSPVDAVKNLVFLLKSLEDGISLLVYVIKKDRIKESTERNYVVFVDGICQKKVPVILVVTNCETEAKMGTWWKENKHYFHGYGMEFEDVISGTAASPSGHIKELINLIVQRRAETRRLLILSLEKCCLSTPWKMVRLREIFIRYLHMSYQEANQLANDIASD